MVDTNKIIGISYIIIQVTLALFISIVGAVHVRRCINEQKQQIELNTAVELNEKKTGKEAGDNKSDNTSDKEDVTGTITEDSHETKQTGFIGLWARTIWKMRSVYSGLAVHCFDVLTDILVIIQWLNLPDDEVDNVNPQIMAYCGIAVVLGSKVISSIAIFLKEGDIRRAALQFIDLLIFEEIYESHKKIISQIKNKKSIKAKQTAIESTLSFKYVRNFEAVFESIPQSVLQLVFIMRVPDIIIDPIFIVSIIQSVVSMTNSILNNDYTHMQEDKWKRHKQRLPPTWECFKHALSRLSEVIYRIGLLSLFWCVCGGVPFSIMLAIDLFLIIGRMVLLIWGEMGTFDADTVLLNLNSLIVTPSEMVYFEDPSTWHELIFCCEDVGSCVGGTMLSLCCCACLAAFITSVGPSIFNRECNTKVYAIPTIKIGTSLMELMFMLFYGLFAENGARKPFLVLPEHGLYIFVATCICLFIYSQYLLLFPDFALPREANVRSKWGYAYANELNELKKVKVRIGRTIKIKKLGDEKPEEYTISTRGQFWDEPIGYSGSRMTGFQPITAAMFALANENYDIVRWLEEQGAVLHKGMGAPGARKLFVIKTD